MNGTVGGYTGPRAGRLPSGTTDKLSEYLPKDILLWEGDDSDSFFFGDAAAMPDGGIGLTSRHARDNGDGQGAVGRAGATAELFSRQGFHELQHAVPRFNELFCGPGYR